MEKFWDIFKQICEIPHCSGETQELANFIEKWGKNCNYEVKRDKASNIICYHKDATMTLQSHYDMVCMGRAPKIELVQGESDISALDSSLGADNGIGVALMLLAMQEQLPVDCLFTSDEEIGLIGAIALEHTIRTKSVLNLDTEESGSVYIGCAGNLDIIAKYPLKHTYIKDAKYYEYAISDLPGGHSGTEIHKNIPNANIELAKFLNKYDIKLVAIDGGQKSNAISNAAKATFIANNEDLPIECKELKESKYTYYYENTKNILKSLINMPHGVIKDNEIHNIPHSSVNLAFVNIKDHELFVEFSLRFLDEEGGEELREEIQSYLNNHGFKIVKEFKATPPWKPKESEFSKRLVDVVKEVEGFAKIKVVHAGLECAILQNKDPKLEFVSIGPDIRHAHTSKERVNKNSVQKLKETMFKFIDAEQKFNNKKT